MMDFQVTKNVVEYEVSIFGVITSNKLRVNSIILHGDSWLVVNQYINAFEAEDNTIQWYIEWLKKNVLIMLTLKSSRYLETRIGMLMS